jgi:phosphatidylserine synthase
MKRKSLRLCLQKKCSLKLDDYEFIFTLILSLKGALCNASKVIVLLLMSVLFLRCLMILNLPNVRISELNFKFTFLLFKIILLSGCLCYYCCFISHCKNLLLLAKLNLKRSHWFSVCNSSVPDSVP